MPDYKPTTEAGRAWLQPSSVILSNPQTEPLLQFNEEEATAIGGGRVIQRPYGPLVAPCDPDMEIPILARESGLETGQMMRLGDLLNAIQSAYVAFAKKRDAV